ncbi:MAG TPA: 2TM domain-containing protein [Actinomycetota bacterium]|nr:2TM domain-containing protein [Actinomycetota bacterium]
MDEFAGMAAREREARRIARCHWFWLHAAVFVPTQLILFVIWIAMGANFPWFAFPLLGWGIILAVHGVYAFVMKTPEEIMIERAAHQPQRS